jgi:hypothetical protein
VAVEIRNGCGCVIVTVSGDPAVTWGSAIGNPKEKIRIEPMESPVPEKTPAPAPVETPVEVPEKVPA